MVVLQRDQHHHLPRHPLGAAVRSPRGHRRCPASPTLFFFSIAVVTKLTADTLDGIDVGPLEAANASGARHSQMLRTAIVPQILPAYASYSLYAFELNLRASSVIGFVGAGGIGQRIQFFQSQNNWEAVWGSS